jgi:hypothetical protein
MWSSQEMIFRESMPGPPSPHRCMQQCTTGLPAKAKHQSPRRPFQNDFAANGSSRKRESEFTLTADRVCSDALPVCEGHTRRFALCVHPLGFDAW